MNFFEHQDLARRNSRWLVVAFFVAIAVVLTAIYGVALLIFGGVVLADENATASASPVSLFNLNTLLMVYAGGTLLMGGAYLLKRFELSAGGQVVAEQLGGKLVQRSTSDPYERRLLNVIDEMALAAGVPAPQVYRLEGQQAINAFAAGNSPEDAVIGVTDGCMRLMTRDELQGVIAHEFSHIVNGDMTLNIRLICVVFGLMVLSETGQLIMRSLRVTGGSSRNKKGEGNAAVAILLFALALAILGYIGAIAATMIRSALSRQREFLADASAVQFTRNPEGIGGALKKLLGLSEHGRVDTPRVEEAAHMFFGNALAPGFLHGLFATHPPLEERIRRVVPNWDGKAPSITTSSLVEVEGVPGAMAAALSQLAGAPARRSAAEVVASVGQPSGAPARRHPVAEVQAGLAPTKYGTWVGGNKGASGGVQDTLSQAQSHADDAGVPMELLMATREPFEAAALALGLLVADDVELAATQLAEAAALTGATIAARAEELALTLQGVERGARLPLLSLATPSLRQLSDPQAEALLSAAQAMIEADGHVTMFEFAVLTLLKARLRFSRSARQRGAGSFDEVAREAGLVLGAFASLDGVATDRAMAMGLSGVAGRLRGRIEAAATASVEPGELLAALETLHHAALTVRKGVFEMCTRAVFEDRTVTADEAALLRAVAEVLGCPLPPLG